VVILPDADPEGKSYATAVLGCLARLRPRPRVRVVRLAGLWQTAAPVPEGGDLDEWLRDGVPATWEPERCREELRRVADSAPTIDLAAHEALEPGSRAGPATSAPPPAGVPKMTRPDADGRETQAQALLRLASVASLSRTADGRAFAEVPVNGHRENHEVRSPRFRWWLVRAFYHEAQRPPSSTALHEALGVLEAKAQIDSPTERFYVRVAPDGGAACYVDLGDDSWRAVRIAPGGWEVTGRPTARFRRSTGSLPLPIPVRGGSVPGLRRSVNVADPDFPLFLAWMTAALLPVGPYPILALSGEQGSAKSTLARLVHRLIDPHVSPLRSEPKEVRDLMIGARNGWVLAFDNLSSLPVWLSNALCRLATGGGFSTRQLFSDSEEVFFDAQRPVVLTGIEDYVGRCDLIDRCVFLHLPAIPDANRQTEAEFWSAFDADHARLFGTVLDAVAGVFERLPEVSLDRLPRMADFAKWGEAVCRSVGMESGVFLTAYLANRQSANEAALEDSPVAVGVRTLMADRIGWVGTASRLLTELSDLIDVESFATKKRWPTSPRALSGHLRRNAPALRMVGVDVAFGRGRDRRVTIKTDRPGDFASAPS
jgi:hypothetical protein